MAVKSKLEVFVEDVDKKDKEPALKIGAVAAFLTSVLSILLNRIFPNLVTEETKDAIFNILMLLLPLVIAYLIRRKVWSPASVEDLIEEVSAQVKPAIEQKKDDGRKF